MKSLIFGNNFNVCSILVIKKYANSTKIVFVIDIEYFKYNKTADSYTCLAQEILTTNGNWYAKKNGKSITKTKHYKTSACLNCKLFTKFTKNAKADLLNTPNMPI